MEITSIGPSYLRLLSSLTEREEAAKRGEYWRTFRFAAVDSFFNILQKGGYKQHAGCLLLWFLLFEFFDHVFKLFEIFVCFDFFVGFAYCVYDLADVGGEAAPVLFYIVFRWMGVYGFLLSHFGKGSEFKDEVESDVLHVEAIFVGDVCESLLYY
jgi:hypothetical protein